MLNLNSQLKSWEIELQARPVAFIDEKKINNFQVFAWLEQKKKVSARWCVSASAVVVAFKSPYKIYAVFLQTRNQLICVIDNETFMLLI